MWQANLCVPLCNYGFASMKVWCDFSVLSFFLVYEIIWLFVAFVELLGLVVSSFLFIRSFRCLCLAVERCVKCS
jgi:hypothetical protein